MICSYFEDLFSDNRFWRPDQHTVLSSCIRLFFISTSLYQIDIDIHEQARVTSIIQASLDLKLGKYYLQKSEYPCPLHSPTCKHVVLCLRVLHRFAANVMRSYFSFQVVASGLIATVINKIAQLYLFLRCYKVNLYSLQVGVLIQPV